MLLLLLLLRWLPIDQRGFAQSPSKARCLTHSDTVRGW